MLSLPALAASCFDLQVCPMLAELQAPAQPTHHFQKNHSQAQSAGTRS
jgi:hypothetical protein